MSPLAPGDDPSLVRPKREFQSGQRYTNRCNGAGGANRADREEYGQHVGSTQLDSIFGCYQL